MCYPVYHSNNLSLTSFLTQPVTNTAKIILNLNRRRFWHATHDCVAPYVDIILHKGWFWAKSAALRSVRWCCFRSGWTVLSHVMRGRPSCLLQSAGGEANKILLASALSSIHQINPKQFNLAAEAKPTCYCSMPTDRHLVITPALPHPIAI